MRSATMRWVAITLSITVGFCDRLSAYCGGSAESQIQNQHDKNRFLASGSSWQRKGEHDKAIADYSEAIRLDPKNSEGYSGRGYGLQRKGEHDKAIADFTSAILLDPKDAEAYYDRALSWLMKNEYEKFTADFDEAVRLDPERKLIH
jgi:tetratricopeptide (TPR) repeat protein